MMKALVSYGFLMCISAVLMSQNIKIPVVVYKNSLDSLVDRVASVAPTTDSGYIITYRNHNTTKGNDYGLIKLDQNGNLQWKRIIGVSTSRIDFGTSIQQVSDGGYIAAGSLDSKAGAGKKNYGKNDFWIVRMDSVGNVLWEKTYGGSNEDQAACIRQTNEGGYIIVGFTFSNNKDVRGNYGAADYWILKITSTGTVEWQKTYGGPDISIPGFPSTMMGAGMDRAKWVEQTSDGGYIVAGQTATGYFSGQGMYPSDVKENHGSTDWWILKLNGKGIIEWQKSIGGSGDEFLEGMRPTKDGGYIVIGEINSINGDITGNPSSDIGGLIVKLNNAGSITWKSFLSFGNGTSNRLYYFSEANDSGFIVAGKITSLDSTFLLKLDASGKTVWQHNYMKGDIYHILVDKDNGFTIVCSAEESGIAKISISKLKIVISSPPEKKKNLPVNKESKPQNKKKIVSRVKSG